MAPTLIKWKYQGATAMDTKVGDDQCAALGEQVECDIFGVGTLVAHQGDDLTVEFSRGEVRTLKKRTCGHVKAVNNVDAATRRQPAHPSDSRAQPQRAAAQGRAAPQGRAAGRAAGRGRGGNAAAGTLSIAQLWGGSAPAPAASVRPADAPSRKRGRTESSNQSDTALSVNTNNPLGIEYASSGSYESDGGGKDAGTVLSRVLL